MPSVLVVYANIEKKIS
jgi:hypothetical protein